MKIKWLTNVGGKGSPIKKFHLFKLTAVFLLTLTANANNSVSNYSYIEVGENLDYKGLQQTITGSVSDALGPLPGVSIVIKGTSQGTTTDFDGNYSIEVADNAAVLVFSYLGYKSQEVPVGSNTELNVTLTEDTSELDEVVVLGYTTRKKGELTGSVSTVSSEEIEKAGNKDLAKSLSGRVPGLIIADRGGLPGSTDGNDITLLIRGKSTLNNNSPLILIDGITASSFSHLAPQDIESLTVLKDGAAAIYGARAANGVILITTKRGKSGKPSVNFSSSYNVSSFSATPDLMSSEEYAIYNNEIAERNGTPLPFTQEDINNYASGTDPINYPNTDWADLTFAKSSPESRNSLSISGGSEHVNYFVSGDFVEQVGMYHSGDLNFKQKQVRSNIDINLTDNFTLGVDLSGRFGNRNQPGVSEGEIYSRINTNEPTEVGIYPNGLPGWGGENGANPYIMSTNESGFNKRIDNELRGKFSFDWRLDNLIDGLRAKGFAGVTRMNNDIKSWYTPWTVYTFQEGSGEYIPSQGFAQGQGRQRTLRESFWKYDELLLNATIYYSKVLGDNHSISSFAGIEQSTSNQRNFWAERRGFPTDDHSELFAGSDDGQQSYGESQEWGRLNYFGSFSYDYKKKYFIDFTIRHDGSSNFGPGKRFGTFPSIAGSWAINQESFMENVEWLNALKLRASWAKMGNDRIAPFQYLTRYNYGGPTNNPQPNYAVFGSPGVSYNGYTSANVPNPNITWETAYMKNLGLNFTMFDNKLSGDINYFYQKREDILVTRAAAIPDAAGITLPAENIGKVDNFGLELELGWRDQVNDNFSYNFGANFTQAKNEVVYLAEAADVPEWRKREGHSMDSYVTYPTAGIFRDQAQVDATPVKLSGTIEGEPIYLDTDGNGSIDANDRIRAYSSNVPEIQFGVFGGFNYKNFDFSFLFQGQAEAEMLIFFERPGARPDFLFNERWTPDNRNARYPRAYNTGDKYSTNQSGVSENFEGADLWLHDASFVRLKQVELGYTFRKEDIKIGDLKVFLRGYNILTMFSDVADLGLDPEANGYYDFRQSTYPSLQTYTLGLNFSF
ncbi:SusC/RagA family TonB-linked outer membrane protein [Arenibacter palladensis]|uniref:SusC/RagA family TonB-linked outer membrane protein n=1 Tax=Arenibacter palladensis TaxID=237373 RepID=UPI0026E3BE77|nr:TonB-dependent receptor [Arenibacter palladensis]MDO6604573.1 TonB-dependent receptor [Arenibacter palladensis]